MLFNISVFIFLFCLFDKANGKSELFDPKDEIVEYINNLLKKELRKSFLNRTDLDENNCQQKFDEVFEYNSANNFAIAIKIIRNLNETENTYDISKSIKHKLKYSKFLFTWLFKKASENCKNATRFLNSEIFIRMYIGSSIYFSYKTRNNQKILLESEMKDLNLKQFNEMTEFVKFMYDEKNEDRDLYCHNILKLRNNTYSNSCPDFEEKNHFSACSKYKTKKFTFWPILSKMHDYYIDNKNLKITKGIKSLEEKTNSFFNMTETIDNIHYGHISKDHFYQIYKQSLTIQSAMRLPFILNWFEPTLRLLDKNVTDENMTISYAICKDGNHNVCLQFDKTSNQSKNNHEEEFERIERTIKKNMFSYLVYLEDVRLTIEVFLLLLGLAINIFLFVIFSKRKHLITYKMRVFIYTLICSNFGVIFISFYKIIFSTMVAYTTNIYLYEDELEEKEFYSMSRKIFRVIYYTLFSFILEYKFNVLICELIYPILKSISLLVGLVIMVNVLLKIIASRNGVELKKVYIFIQYFVFTFCIFIIAVYGIAFILTISFINGIIKSSTNITSTMPYEEFSNIICNPNLNNISFLLILYKTIFYVSNAVYTIVALITYLYYKIETRTSTVKLNPSTEKDLSRTIWSLFLTYGSYLVSHGFFMWYQIIRTIPEKDNELIEQDIAQYGYIYRWSILLHLVDIIVHPILIIFRIKSLNQLTMDIIKHIDEYGIFNCIGDILWFPLEFLYLYYKNYNAVQIKKLIRKKRSKSVHFIVSNDKKKIEIEDISISSLLKQLEAEKIKRL